MGKSMLVNMNDILLPAKEGKYGVGFFKRNTASQTVLRWY